MHFFCIEFIEIWDVFAVEELEYPAQSADLNPTKHF